MTGRNYLQLGWVLGNVVLFAIGLLRPELVDVWVLLSLALGVVGGVLLGGFCSRLGETRGSWAGLSLAGVLAGSLWGGFWWADIAASADSSSRLLALTAVETVVAATWLSVLFLRMIFDLVGSRLKRSARLISVAAISVSAALVGTWWFLWGADGHYRSFIFLVFAALPVVWLLELRSPRPAPWQPARLSAQSALPFPALTWQQQLRAYWVFGLTVAALTGGGLFALIRFDPDAARTGVLTVLAVVAVASSVGSRVTRSVTRRWTQVWTLQVADEGVRIGSPGQRPFQIGPEPGELYLVNNTAAVQLRATKPDGDELRLVPQLDQVLGLPSGHGQLLAAESGLPAALATIGYECLETRHKDQLRLTFRAKG